jgi:hypothetical protein
MDPPSVDSPAHSSSPDTGRLQPYEDSILDTLRPDRRAITRTGDTLSILGGGIMDSLYGVGEYQKNSRHYMRIERFLGNRANGMAVKSIVATVLLPPMDSTDHLMFSGLCGINRKSDPYVIALVGPGGDSVYSNIISAWRFEASAARLRSIPPRSVVCWDPGED